MSEQHPDCQLNAEPFFQCCCKCVYRLPVHYHCCTEPKPTDEQKKAAGIEGRCVCGVQKGWACVAPEFGVVSDNWPEHSCGCELYTTKEDSERHAARVRKATDLLFRTEHPNAPRFNELNPTNHTGE